MTITTRKAFLALMAMALPVGGAFAQEEEAAAEAETEAAQEQAASEEKPLSPPIPLEQIPWETNMDDPPFGSPDAIRGGTITLPTSAYPDTYRLVGPNANSSFANFIQPFQAFGLVGLHSHTDNFIPILASHWHVAPDNRTVYYKLDERARWSDGEPITADDYLFAYDFLQDERLADPYYIGQIPRYISAIEKLDDYTLKIVAKEASWKPLVDTAIVMPFPQHAIDLEPVDGEPWIDRANYAQLPHPGPYSITDQKLNESVTFTRLSDWWGDEHRYLKNQFNPDEIVIKVILDRDRHLDYFKRGEIDILDIRTARIWKEGVEEADGFEALEKGWVKARVVHTEAPQGVYGIGFNLTDPIVGDVNFRRALQHLFPFDVLNEEIMNNAYYRQTSLFQNTEYMNKELEPYAFDPRQARQYLQEAGYTKRGNDGILEKPSGERASFTLLFGSPGLEPHLTVVQNFFKRGGVEMNLQRIEPGAAFARLREKATQAFLMGMTANFYPEPWQYFHSSQAFTEDGKPKQQTNNFWAYADDRVDELVDIYTYDMDKEDRLAAMAELDARMRDEAILIPFWYAGYSRLLYWDYVQWPEEFLPRRADGFVNDKPGSWSFWINPDRKKALEAAMKEGKALDGEKGIVEVDPYGLRAAKE